MGWFFSLGPYARFDVIDQENVFRADHINLDDAHLYCYQASDLWFIDIRDPVGDAKMCARTVLLRHYCRCP
jgi:hypothetical protein